MSSVHGHDVRLDWGLAVVEVLNAQRDNRSSMEGNHTARVGRMHARESVELHCLQQRCASKSQYVCSVGAHHVAPKTV